MTAATKRASVPRSKAAARSNGYSGAAADNVTPPPPPDQPAPNLVEQVDHPYGDRRVFVWRPRGGGEPIVLPHISTVNTTQEFFCKIYDLNEMFQSFEWLILAGVPKSIRVRVARLGDTDPAEQANLFRSWFAPISRPTGGEPPGES
jgi:hypothetical protein